ncbi:MAG TPA: hypothetical protein VGP91_10845 [Actinoplanes sp.]|jgi:hypothetical protein|nr:hypothetical protein [Actinoplanes sp.]
MWIVVAAVVVGMIVLVAAVAPVLGRLSGLRRAVTKLQRRQADAMRLRAAGVELERSLVALRERADEAQRRLAVIKAARGAD